jgi:hypothetical protein
MAFSLTPEERQQIEAAFENLDREDPEAFNEIFCACWPCTKELLSLLKKRLPEWVATLLQLLIDLGDKQHKKCPAKP